VTRWSSREIPEGVSTVFWVVAGIGVAVVAALRLQVVSIHPFHWGYLANAFLVALGLELVVGFVCLALTRRVEPAVRCAVGFTMLVLWWSAFSSLVIGIGQDRIEAVLTALVAGTITYAILRFGRAVGVVVLSGVLVGAMVAVAVAETELLPMSDQVIGSIVESVDPIGTPPDLLVVILDSYARGDTLQAVYSADNDRFLSELSDMGFAVNQQARSNYNRTYASVASMLALDTLITPDGDTEHELSVMRSVSGGDGEFLRAFKRAGYSITFVPSIWPGSYCGEVVDRCIEIGVTRHNIYWLFRTSLISPIANRLMPYPWSAASWTRVTNLAQIHLESKFTGPTITWIHVALPHPPATLGSDCKVHTEQWRRSLVLTVGEPEDELRRQAFAKQTECIDSVVVDQLRAVVEVDPSVAILLLSDHGPDGQMQVGTSLQGHTIEQIHEKLAVLLAFRGPGRCRDAVDQPSVVGVMRGVTRCLLGASVADPYAGSYLVPHEAEIADGMKPLQVADEELP